MIVMVQVLSDRDFKTRTRLCQDILQKARGADVIIFSEEAHFYLSGAGNKQNFRYWSLKRPQVLYQCPLHSPKVPVWSVVFFCSQC